MCENLELRIEALEAEVKRLGCPVQLSEWLRRRGGRGRWVLGVARVLVLAGFGVCVLLGFWRVSYLGFEHVWLTGLGLVGLSIAVLWEYIERLAVTREVAVGREGVKLGAPQSGPADAGTVRDSFLYLGRFYLYDRKDAEQALHFFQGAHRMSKSILSAFRCMESCAKLGREPDVREWYCEALLLAEKSALNELSGRGALVEWVLQHRADTPEQLMKAAQAVDL